MGNPLHREVSKKETLVLGTSIAILVEIFKITFQFHEDALGFSLCYNKRLYKTLHGQKRCNSIYIYILVIMTVRPS